MTKEEIEIVVRRLLKKWGLNHLDGCACAVEIWNAAIDCAAENSQVVGSHSSPTKTLYKYDSKSGRSYWVDKPSITSLKFKTDE